MPISKDDFQYVVQLARSQAGISLEAGKEYLAESRLGPLAESEGFSSLSRFIAHLRAAPQLNGVHFRALCALVTHETFFFRDVHPFEALRRTLIPRMLDEHRDTRRLTIWSAACSTGQEPYSMAMLIREYFPETFTWDVSILATDLSPTALKKARAAVYSELEVDRGLPSEYLAKFFCRRERHWRVAEEVKRLVEFRELNLVQAWPAMPLFDVIFLRNVLIYFDVETKQKVLERMLGLLQPRGCLFLGTSETTLNLHPGYELVEMDGSVAYRRAAPVLG